MNKIQREPFAKPRIVVQEKARFLIQEQMRGSCLYNHISSELVRLESHHKAFVNAMWI
jgi:hypothetical protein